MTIHSNCITIVTVIGMQLPIPAVHGASFSNVFIPLLFFLSFASLSVHYIYILVCNTSMQLGSCMHWFLLTMRLAWNGTNRPYFISTHCDTLQDVTGADSAFVSMSYDTESQQLIVGGCRPQVWCYDAIPCAMRRWLLKMIYRADVHETGVQSGGYCWKLYSSGRVWR